MSVPQTNNRASPVPTCGLGASETGFLLLFVPVFNNDLASKDIPFKDGMTQKSVFIYKFLRLGKKNQRIFFSSMFSFPFMLNKYIWIIWIYRKE